MAETTRPPAGNPTPASTAAGEAAARSTIAEMLEPFQQEAAATRVAVEDRLRVLRRIAMWLAAFVGVTVLLVALVLVILIQNRSTSARARASIHANAELSAQIADCTSVGGKCYEQSQARLRSSIALLVTSNRVIAKCARSTDTDDAFDACVDKSLAEVTPKPVPSPTTGR